MQAEVVKTDRISFIKFEDIFDEGELEQLWLEVSFLCNERKFLAPEQSKSALYEDGSFKKSNKCIWLDTFYHNRSMSNYLSLYFKPIDGIFQEKDHLIENDIDWKLFFNTNRNNTVLSYYENEDYYDTHTDRSCYTFLFWLFKEPKQFSGGDFIFPELDRTITVRSNMAVLFPSWLDHKVTAVKMHDSVATYKSNGRFAFSTFFFLDIEDN